LPLILAMASIAKSQPQMDPCSPEAKQAQPNPAQSYLDDRHRRYLAFQPEFEELQREAKFADVVGAGGEADWRLCKPDAFSAQDSEQLQIFFKAYRHRRLASR
jgi:hypothetical protein